MRKQMEIKQELINSEENGDFINSVTSLDHFNYQLTTIEKEENCTSQAGENNVHLNKITSLTCQVKTEPQSEEGEKGCKLENTGGPYPDGFVIKREIIEVHTEDQHMIDNEANHRNTTEDENNGTETNLVTKSENDNWSLNCTDNNIGEQNNKFDLIKEMNKQQICGRIGEETKNPHSQAETLCQSKKSHKCSVCAKAFQSSQASLRHMWNTHTGENPYTCEVCGKNFKYLSKLQRHRAVHSDERPFSCNVCNKTFKYMRVLQNHKSLSNERPYSCILCNKAFKCKEHLQYHKMHSHSDERRYSCDVCKKAFKCKRTLQRHMVLCHSVERPYPCDVCNKAFKQKCDLQRHKVSCHSNERPYFCDVCDKAFKQKCHLQRHKALCHSNERPYPCDVCNKAFKQKIDLQRHKVSCHSNERPYSCDLCKKTFKHKGHLDSHKRSVHSDEKPHP